MKETLLSPERPCQNNKSVQKIPPYTKYMYRYFRHRMWNLYQCSMSCIAFYYKFDKLFLILIANKNRTSCVVHHQYLIRKIIRCFVINTKSSPLYSFFFIIPLCTILFHQKIGSLYINLRKATASYRAYSIPGKTATLVPEFAVEDLSSTELQPRFLRLEWRACPRAEHSNDILYMYVCM